MSEWKDSIQWKLSIHILTLFIYIIIILLQSYVYINLHHQLFITAAACVAEEILRRTRIWYMMAFRSLSLFVSFLMYRQFLKSTKLAIWIFWPVNLSQINSEFHDKNKVGASPLNLGPKQGHWPELPLFDSLICLKFRKEVAWSCDKRRKHIVLFFDTGIWIIHGQHLICIVQRCVWVCLAGCYWSNMGVVRTKLAINVIGVCNSFGLICKRGDRLI